MVEPERALFLHSLPPDLPPEITRIYAGAEFCPWRLPEACELQRFLLWAHARARAFSLVTPLLIEPLRDGLRQVLVALLPLFAPGDEVVISDWGVLALVREVDPVVPVVLGRALSGQKRDARTLELPLTAAQQDHFRRGSCYSSSFVALLRDLGISRVELDNLMQGVAPLPEALRGTLHVPYAMVACSRNCPFREPGSATPCPQPCGEVFTLRAADSPVPLLQGGNAQFLCNAHLPEELAALGIDRVVEHPALPW